MKVKLSKTQLKNLLMFAWKQETFVLTFVKKKLQKTIKLGFMKHLTSLFLPMCIVVSYKQFSCTMT